MSLPRVVFVTYYRLVPTGQMGICKRALRLISRLLGDFEVHLVNFGPRPEADPLFAAMSRRIELHETPDAGLGEALHALFGRLAPRAVVLCESPIRGSMRMAHRAASRLGLRQIGLDNFYGPLFTISLLRGWPRIDRWLLLGLTEDGSPALADGPIEVVPPLVRFPPGFGSLPRDRIAVIGYDRETLLSGARLLQRLPPGQPVDLFVSPEGEGLLRRQGFDAEQPGVRTLVLPPDDELYGSLARSRFVFAKAGFQQVVEGILLGAPVVCQLCGGGVERTILADYLLPYVRFVSSGEELPEVLLDVACWLAHPPANRWAGMASSLADPIAFAAERLAAAIG
jgi:hypothetical protein